MIKPLLLMSAAALLTGAAFAQPAATLSPGSGEGLFTTNCGGCHGFGMDHGSGPSLFDPTLLSTRSDAMLLYTIRNGRPGTRMPPWKGLLSDEQIGLIIAYARAQSAQNAAVPGR